MQNLECSRSKNIGKTIAVIESTELYKQDILQAIRDRKPGMLENLLNSVKIERVNSALEKFIEEAREIAEHDKQFAIKKAKETENKKHLAEIMNYSMRSRMVLSTIFSIMEKNGLEIPSQG